MRPLTIAQRLWPVGGLVLLLGLPFVLSACASKPQPNATVSLAQTNLQRGAKAFAAGDWVAAQRDYSTALHIYETLGDTPGRASALLSLARVAAQSGRTEQALQAVGMVLADAPLLPAATVITAHGRAAALQLGQSNAAQADQHLAQATTLCGGTCAQVGALALLRARSALVKKQAALALQLATDALALPQLAKEEQANARRLQAQAYLELGQPQAAVAPANSALLLDQTLGLAERVLLDLQLLAQAHDSMGEQAQALQYQGLAQRAQAAAQALRNGAQEP